MAIKNFIKENLRIIALCSCAILLNFVIFLKYLKNNENNNPYIILVYLLVFIIVNIIAIIGIIISQKNQWPIEKIFLVFGLIYGALMVFALPIGRAPDEPAHFWRAYELSEFQFFSHTSEGGEIGHSFPANLKELTSTQYDENGYEKILNNITVTTDQERVISTSSADGYFFINYIPQILGIWFGKITGLPILITNYVSKLFNMIFCVLTIYYCIKYIPIFKKFLFLLCFSPMVIHQFASASADGTILCGGLIIVSFVLYMIYGTERKITKKDLLILLIACLMLCVTKPVYAPLCFVLFFIPKERFGSIKKKIFPIVIIGAITILFFLFNRVIESKAAAELADSAVATSEQISFILSNPLKFGKALFSSMNNNIMFYLTRALGFSLEWFSVEINELVILIYILCFILICAEECTKVDLKMKIFAIGAFFISTILIFTALYLCWSEVGAPIISGVQGRYFLPLALLIPICFLPIGKAQICNSKRILLRNISVYSFSFFAASLTIITLVGAHI